MAPGHALLSTHLALIPDAFISLGIHIIRCQGEADQSPFQPLGFNLSQCLLSYEVGWLQESKIMMMNECSDTVTRLEMQAFKFAFAIFLANYTLNKNTDWIKRLDKYFLVLK